MTNDEKLALVTEIATKAKALERAINDLVNTFQSETGCIARVEQVPMMDGYKVRIKAALS